MTSPDVSLVIPMFNEGENIAYVVPPLASALRSAGVSFEIILVDNGSWDDTAQRIAALVAGDTDIRSVTVPKNRGYGNGVLCGMRAGRGKYVAYMSGDGQVRPEDALLIIKTALGGNRPFVKAARRIRRDGLARHIASIAYNALLRVRFGTPTWDANGTPKVVESGILQRLELLSEDNFLDAELMIKMTRAGIRPFEVPIVFYPREKGRSTVGAATVIEFLRNIMAPGARIFRRSR